MKALDSFFPDGHPLKRILNRHIVRLSYRTMPNMATIISRHNNKLLKQLQLKTDDEARTCSCSRAVRDSGSCPMRGQCFLNSTIYQVTVTEADSGQVKTYTGLASTYWKSRLAVHKAFLKHKPKPGAKSSNSTELSIHVWELKEKNTLLTKLTGKFWTENNLTTQQAKSTGSASLKNII